MAVKPIPGDYHSVTPTLMVNGAAGLIDFLARAFGATERMRMAAPDGKLMHAEVQLGDSVVMLGDPLGDWPANRSLLYLYVEDCDATYRNALDAGAKSFSEPENQFWGDRSATVDDPFGNRWQISTRVEDVPQAEMERRMKDMMPA